MKKTPLIVSGAAAALVLAGGSSAMAMTHQVDMDVYGKHSSVRLLSGTVGDALQGQGVALKPTDQVTPSVQTPLSEVAHITVQHRNRVTITVDGKTTTKLTTAHTVGGALKGFEIPAGATISPAPTAKLSAKSTNAITVTTTKQVTFTGQNGQATFAVSEPTVAEAAAAHLTDIQPPDRYYDANNAPLDPAAPVTDGLTARVERVRESDTTSTESIDFATKTVEDDSKPAGSTTVQTEGVPGSAEVVTHTTTVDGKVVDQKVTDKKVTQDPVDKVIVKGTHRDAPAPAATTEKPSSPSDATPSTKAAPASPSSSPAPTKSAPADDGGSASGPTTTCSASFYGRGDGTDGGPTASGETFNSEAMTAAHKTLPLGTRIRVTNPANGKSVVVKINDRGPYVSGRCLDLSAGAFDAIGSTGSGTMTVSYQVVG